jgi:hypothetical protein
VERIFSICDAIVLGKAPAIYVVGYALSLSAEGALLSTNRRFKEAKASGVCMFVDASPPFRNDATSEHELSGAFLANRQVRNIILV